MDAGITEDKTMEKNSLVCRLVRIETVCYGRASLLVFDWDGPKPEAGQFFLVRPEGAAVFLPRPLSVAICRSNDRKWRVSFLVARRGKGTDELLSMRKDERARLTGPLGNRWADFLPPADSYRRPPWSPSAEHYVRWEKPRPLGLVAGGAGIAPIGFLRRELLRSSVPYRLLAGFRGGREGLSTLAALDIRGEKDDLVSEDGAGGESGLVTDYLKAWEFAAVFACGPGPMMRTVAALCRSADVPCFVSLEEHMACGAGACLGCSVPTVSGNKRCCSDGPIFNAEEVFFDEL
jgi:NAD(P)H-flavin reductase